MISKSTLFWDEFSLRHVDFNINIYGVFPGWYLDKDRLEDTTYES